MKKSKVSFDLILALDVETSGIAFGEPNPVINPNTGERFQTLSIGLIVASVSTLKPIDSLYLEIKFDESAYTWSDGAEKVHGLSREYLDQNGVTIREAVGIISDFIGKYFGPVEVLRRITLLGHNVATFDKFFLEDLYRFADKKIQLGNRHIDTFSLGVITVDAFSSDELFDFFGFARDPANHNALDDARHALSSARMIKKMFNQSIS